MRKNLWLMIALGLWLHNTNAQSQLSMEQYYYVGGSAALNPTPIASFQMNSGFYAEGRYNYEDINTFSLYMGKTFAKESKLSYSVSAMAGAVIGNLNGGSLAANISIGYKNFYLFSQPQYTFSLENSVNNYTYHWTDLTYSPLDWLSLGLSVQHTKPHYSGSSLEKGIVAEIAYKKWSFPVYAFSPQNSDRYFVVGANLELNFRKRKIKANKNDEMSKMPDYAEILKENTVSEEDKDPEEKQPELLAKVRRVNVIVRTKTGDIEPAPASAAKSVAASPGQVNKAKNVSQSRKANEKSPARSRSVQENSNKPLTRTDQNKEISARNVQDGGTSQKNPAKAINGNSENRKIESISEIPASRNSVDLAKDNQQLYAISIGPFQNEKDAMFIKSKLSFIFNTESTMYPEGGLYKIRISGFIHQTEAELYIKRAMNSGFKNPFSIITYQGKLIKPQP